MTELNSYITTNQADDYLCSVLFRGTKIIESIHLTEKGEPISVRRSWRERLFTRPWRPFVRTKIIISDVPHRGALQLPNGILVMHPQTLKAFREELNKRL